MNNVEIYDKQVRFQEELRNIQEKRLMLEQEFYNLSKTDKKLQYIRTNKLRSYWKQVSERERHARQRNEALLKDFNEFEQRLHKIEAETARLEILKNKCEDELTKLCPQWRYGIDITKAKKQLQDSGIKFEAKPALPIPDQVLTSSPPPSLIPHIDMPLFKLVPFNFNQNAMSLRVDSPNALLGSPEKRNFGLDNSNLEFLLKRDEASRDDHAAQVSEISGRGKSSCTSAKQTEINPSIVVPPVNLPLNDKNATSRMYSHNKVREDNEKKVFDVSKSAYKPSVSNDHQASFGSSDIVNKSLPTHQPDKVDADKIANAVSTEAIKGQEGLIYDESAPSSFGDVSHGSRNFAPAKSNDFLNVKPATSLHENVTSRSSSRKVTNTDEKKVYDVSKSAYHPSVSKDHQASFKLFGINKSQSPYPINKVKSIKPADAGLIEPIKDQEGFIHDESELSSLGTISLGSKSAKHVKPVMSVHIDQKTEDVSNMHDITSSKTSLPIKILRSSIESQHSGSVGAETSLYRTNRHESKSSNDDLVSENQDSEAPQNDVPLTANPAYLKMRQLGDSSVSLDTSKTLDDENDPHLENLVSPKPKLSTISDDEFSDDDQSLPATTERKTTEKTSESVPAVKKPTFTSRFSAKKQKAPWDTESDDEDSYRIPRAGSKVSTDDDDDDFAFFD